MIEFVSHLPRWIISALASIAFGANALTAAFHGDPPDAHHPWAVHDYNRPQPPRVEPSEVPNGAPSDAVILFDGTEASLDNWYHLKPPNQRKGDWIVKEGVLQSVAGAGFIASKEEFGDCQLHIEWLAPAEIKSQGQGRGNSGIFLMGMVEIQVLDNYKNSTYPDGTVGAIYGVMPPAANSLRGPGQWQSADIIFRRPIVRDGVVLDEGAMTVLINGVVVQDSTPLEGGSSSKHRQPLNRVFPDKGSLRLQDHGNPVSYRNIWYRALRPRALDGGVDGRLSEEATKAKRAEIAADIRSDAQSLAGLDRVLRQLESLVYVKDEATWKEAERSINQHIQYVNQLSTEALEKQRVNLMKLYNALVYLRKHDLVASDNAVIRQLIVLIDAQGWKRKKL